MSAHSRGGGWGQPGCALRAGHGPSVQTVPPWARAAWSRGPARALQCLAGAPQLPGASPGGEGGRPGLLSQSPGPRGAGIHCFAAGVGRMGSCFLRERVLAVVSVLSCLLRRFYKFHDFGSWFSLQKAGGGGWVTAAREAHLFLQSERPFPGAEPGRDAPCRSAGRFPVLGGLFSEAEPADRNMHPTAMMLTSTVRLLQTLCLSAGVHAEVMQGEATRTLCGLLRVVVESGTTDTTRMHRG